MEFIQLQQHIAPLLIFYKTIIKAALENRTHTNDVSTIVCL
jgi:hypothetical protein